MSELEIKKRQEYKKNRRKWTIIQLVAITVMIAIALASFLTYDTMNRTYYIEYTENGSIDYMVQYKENDFFEDEWLESGQAYITSLVDGILADFEYKLNIDTNNVGFEYTYKIDATLTVNDKDTNNVYYSMKEELVPSTNPSTKRSNNLGVYESVYIDFVKYNNIASSFVELYALKNSSSTLIVTLTVNVVSTCDEFESSNTNYYSTSLNIPLATETFSIFSTASVPTSESQVLAYSGATNQELFYISGIVTSVIAGLLIIGLMVFLHLTKNEDITYAARVRKLLNAYSSYIQRMDGEFDSHGYQTVAIKTFNEMLGIRDTIQSPILMFENKDQTMTRFLIPTNSKILYVYELKVDNYDEIYSKAE